MPLHQSSLRTYKLRRICKHVRRRQNQNLSLGKDSQGFAGSDSLRVGGVFEETV